MIYKSLMLASLSFIMMSCSFSNKDKESKASDNKKIDELTLQNPDGTSLLLFQQKCYSCHSVTSKSHDEIIAPPMEAIKRRYKITYQTEKQFVVAFKNWAMDPKEENALMRGAVKSFNVMPKQPFNSEEIIRISHYIYNNEIEKPDWFQKHFSQEHPNGMRNGKGRGAGNRKF